MESTCLRLTELPSTSRLFADYIYHFDRVRRFYEHNPSEPESFRSAAAQIDYPDARRAELIAALAKRNAGSPLLDSLAQPGTVAVVTGQQVGLLGGPLYTIFKALTAVKLARKLSEDGIRAVPVFWLATEDHDFAEVNHVWVFDPQNQPRRIEAPDPGRPGAPVGGLPVDGGFEDQVRAALDGFPFCEDVARTVGETYVHGAGFGSAFESLLRRLLGSHEMLFLDPMQPEVRRLAGPFLARAVERAPELTRAVIGRTRELEEAGYHGQVHIEEQTSLVFRLEGGRRIALRRSAGEYTGNGVRFTAAELAADGAALSPNALLRPVAQDYMLPTVAYVGGPAELAYLAQSQVLYRELLGRMPVAFHRYTATLVDEKAGKRIDRYGLRLPDFFHGEGALRERMARALTPQALAGLIDTKRAQIVALLDELAAGLTGFDPSLSRAFEKSRRKMAYQLLKIEAKAAREAMRRDERAVRDAACLAGLIFPNKHLQERLYSILPFVARHGFELVDRIYDEIKLECPDHRIVAL